ncbi:hypothetical protein, partial [Reichenbachiella sp. 5M10]|uniref:hypothetical protein n=1 Tax=Reichenbachiella sp. 5M10 TaxID=1889772 RepID=UPI0013042B79
NTYFVVVTDNDGGDDNLGCETTATRVLTNEQQVITATLDNIAITDCNPRTGSVTITDVFVDAASVTFTSGYSFEWYTDADVQLTGEATASISGYDAGDYYVLISNNSTSCVSDKINFTIDDNSVAPTVSINIIEDDSSCGGTPNGELQAVVNGGVATGFDFQWYHTAVAAGNEVGTNSATLSGI